MAVATAGREGGTRTVHGAVIFADIVESVRLLRSDPVGYAALWSSLLDEIELSLCPRFGATYVKRLGDGIMVVVGSGAAAVRLAFAIHELVSEWNAGLPPERQFAISCGIDEGPLIMTARDVYGHSANLAARLAGLARENQIVLSDGVRRSIPPEFENWTVDLGECHVRNIAEPVRAHAIGEAASAAIRPLLIPDAALRPVIAVVPPTGNGGEATDPIGDAFADEVIREIGQCGALNVISRLSTRRLLAESGDLIGAARQFLAADYALSGRWHRAGDDVVLDIEFADARAGLVIWNERIEQPVAALFDGRRDAAFAVAGRVVRSVLRSEIERSRSASLPTLASYTLLLSGISAMYSLNRSEFFRANELLGSLASRASRQSTPLAWIAKWHVLRVVQGWSSDRDSDAREALALTTRALDADPENALALTIEGLVHTNLRRRFDLGEECFQAALERNPNEPLAWLIRGALMSFTDRGAEAVRDTGRALALSPLDPHRFYHLALAAGAHLTAGDDATALRLAEASYRANRQHHSTLRILAVARWRLGQEDEARQAVGRLMALDPGFTVSGYLTLTPAAAYRIGQEVAHILRAAGVPP